MNTIYHNISPQTGKDSNAKSLNHLYTSLTKRTLLLIQSGIPTQVECRMHESQKHFTYIYLYIHWDTCFILYNIGLAILLLLKSTVIFKHSCIRKFCFPVNGNCEHNYILKRECDRFVSIFYEANWQIVKQRIQMAPFCLLAGPLKQLPRMMADYPFDPTTDHGIQTHL